MRYLVFLSFLLLFECETKSQKNQVDDILFSFEYQHSEISGMVWDKQNSSLFMLQDKGNKPEIIIYNAEGIYIKSTKIKNIQNTDWEELTQDQNGMLYIGDFGNNKNERQNLAIYKVNPNEIVTKKEVEISQTTKFSYPDQVSFPPKKNQLLFDCEAFVEKDGFFYLFTKNRSKKSDGTFHIYRVPNQEGTFVAEKLAELKTCSSKDCLITGAVLTPDSDNVLLLTHNKVFRIPFGEWKQEKITHFELNHSTQKEALTFYNDSILWVSDENETGDTGNVYQINFVK